MGLIIGILVIFTVAVIPTKSNPEPIRRGLDLKGGTHLSMRVNVGDAVRLETDQAMEALKSQSAKNTLPAPATRRVNDSTFLAVPPAGVGASAYDRLVADYKGEWDVNTTNEGAMEFKMKAAAITTIERDTVAHVVETIDNRVNALGVTEPYIAPESGYRIVIQLPGVDDPARVKDIIKTTAQLQFRLVEGNPGSDPQTALNSVAANLRDEVDVLPSTRENELGQAAGTEYLAVRKTVPVTGTDLKTSRVQKGRLGEPVIGMSFTPDGARKFGDFTGANIGRKIAIVLDNKIQ
ncbi:MAG TPA: hypothetical protein VGJ88_08870, partial [Thermoanaerobaculia bacterium]